MTPLDVDSEVNSARDSVLVGKNRIVNAFRHFPQKYCLITRSYYLYHRKEVFESGDDSIFARGSVTVGLHCSEGGNIGRLLH